MSLDKSIKHKKEWRKPYRKAKAIDRNCRNHGSCPYCENNRLNNSRRKDIDFSMKLKEYNNE